MQKSRQTKNIKKYKIFGKLKIIGEMCVEQIVRAPSQKIIGKMCGTNREDN